MRVSTIVLHSTELSVNDVMLGWADAVLATLQVPVHHAEMATLYLETHVCVPPQAIISSIHQAFASNVLLIAQLVTAREMAITSLLVNAVDVSPRTPHLVSKFNFTTPLVDMVGDGIQSEQVTIGHPI